MPPFERLTIVIPEIHEANKAQLQAIQVCSSLLSSHGAINN